MDNIDRSGYAKYVEEKVYKPFNSSVSSSQLEKRVEKLEYDKVQTDRAIQELTSIIDSIRNDNKENISSNLQYGYAQKHMTNQRDDNCARFNKIDDQLGQNKFGYEQDSGLNQNYFNKSEIIDKLNFLENRIENALKRQAEDIAADVTELERQLRSVQTKSKEQSAISPDKFDFRRFESYIMEKVDANLKEVNQFIMQYKSDEKSLLQFVIEPSNLSMLDIPKRSFSDNHTQIMTNEKVKRIMNNQEIRTGSEIRTCHPQKTLQNNNDKSNLSNDLFNDQKEFDNSMQRINESFVNTSKTQEFTDTFNNTPSLVERQSLWNLKEKVAKHMPEEDRDVSNLLNRKNSRKESRKKNQKSSHKKQKRSASERKKRISRTNSIHGSTNRSQSSRSRDREINKSVRLVKDLTEKCLHSILNSSKVEGKSKGLKVKKIKSPYTKIATKPIRKKSKCETKLSKLEKMYHELSIMEKK